MEPGGRGTARPTIRLSPGGRRWTAPVGPGPVGRRSLRVTRPRVPPPVTGCEPPLGTRRCTTPPLGRGAGGAVELGPLGARRRTVPRWGAVCRVGALARGDRRGTTCSTRPDGAGAADGAALGVLRGAERTVRSGCADGCGGAALGVLRGAERTARSGCADGGGGAALGVLRGAERTARSDCADGGGGAALGARCGAARTRLVRSDEPGRLAAGSRPGWARRAAGGEDSLDAVD